MEPPSKKPRYDQVWLDEYNRRFKDNGIVKSDRSTSHVFCKLCKNHFSIKSGGAHDIKKHCASLKHSNAERAQASTTSQNISNFFRSDKEDFSIIQSEVVFTKFIIMRDLPISIADDAGNLMRAMFPNVSLMKDYRCGRTKTTAIIHTLAAAEKEDTMDKLRNCDVFSLSTDGGNDKKHKLYPIIVRYCDHSREKIVTEILSIDTLPTVSSKGIDIYNHLQESINNLELSFDRCISFSADNASVMMGEVSGVAAHLHKQNQNISMIGCPCHRINLAVYKAANALNVKIDQLLIDIFYFLDKSQKRVARLKELQSILNVEDHEILKHVNTRWLSLGPCINRLLEQWEPLSALFLEISEEKQSKSTSSKAQSILRLLLDSETKAYAQFLSNVISVFENANASLQADEPLIHKVREIMKSVVRDLSMKFISPSVLKDSDVLEIDVNNKSNILPYSELDVGYKCKDIVLKELTEEGKKKFHKSIVGFFQNAVNYLQKNCSLKDETLINAAVADPDKRLTSSFSCMEFFIIKFPNLLPKEKPKEEGMDELMRQFRDWQISDLDKKTDEAADAYWFRLHKMQTQSGQWRFHLLSRCMLGVLTSFHSNAACERLFSFVRRTRTDFRKSMSNQLLQSLAICKTKWGPEFSYEDKISKDLLVKCKKATKASLEN